MNTINVENTRSINGGADICYNGYILSKCGGEYYTTCQVCKKRYTGFGCISSMLWHCIFTGHMR